MYVIIMYVFQYSVTLFVIQYFIISVAQYDVIEIKEAYYTAELISFSQGNVTTIHAFNYIQSTLQSLIVTRCRLEPFADSITTLITFYPSPLSLNFHVNSSLLLLIKKLNFC